MSIAFKEGLKIPPPALNEIILASNHDVRQVGNTGYEIPDQIVLFIFFYSSLYENALPLGRCFVACSRSHMPRGTINKPALINRRIVFVIRVSIRAPL